MKHNICACRLTAHSPTVGTPKIASRDVPRADIRYSGNPVGSNELGAHPGREMREDEEHTEPIMRHEVDIHRSLTRPVGAPVAKSHPVSMPR